MKFIFPIAFVLVLAHCQSSDDKRPVVTETTRTCLRGDCFSGFGIQQRGESEVYSGIFRHGMYNGIGQIKCLKSGEFINGNFQHGWIEGDFELKSDRMTMSGQIAAGKFEGLVRVEMNTVKQRFVIEKSYKNGKIDGVSTLTFIPENIQFRILAKDGAVLRAIFVENGVQKGSATYRQDFPGKCSLIFKEERREEKAEIECIDGKYPEIFRGCSR